MRILAAVLLALGCAASGHAQSRLAYARYELAGPMSAAELGFAPGSRTKLSGELLAGERVERVLPVVVDEFGARGEPHWSWQGDPENQGRARFLGWDRSAEEQWGKLPPGLQLRSRPPVLPADARPPAALFLLLAGCALGSVVLARKRAVLAALPALAGCALAWLLAHPASGARVPWLVLEGAGMRSPWVEQRADWETLELPSECGPVLLASEPPRASIALATSLSAPGPITLQARGAALFASRALDPGPGSLDSGSQDCAPTLEQVWWREAGEWSYRPNWAKGQPLPPAQPGGPPPGWLATGLPQGPRVCIAGTTGRSPRWFRDVGP